MTELQTIKAHEIALHYEKQRQKMQTELITGGTE